MDFIQFARAHGVEIDPSKLYPSDRIKRTGTTAKPKSDNGAYFYDGQRGWVMDWSGEAKVIWWNDPKAKPWTEQDKEQWRARQASRSSAQQAEYEQVAQAAWRILQGAKLEQHPYLQYKGFLNERGLVVDGELLIPMRNCRTNVLQGFQRIYWDPVEMKYEKKMFLGMRAKNAVCRFGHPLAAEFWLVEGYATGLSVQDALKSAGLDASVIVCFSASNLIAVADQIRRPAFVFADNDASQTGQKAAESTGLPWTMADEVGMDANDLHEKRGLWSVMQKIHECRKLVHS